MGLLDLTQHLRLADHLAVQGGGDGEDMAQRLGRRRGDRTGPRPPPGERRPGRRRPRSTGRGGLIGSDATACTSLRSQVDRNTASARPAARRRCSSSGWRSSST